MAAAGARVPCSFDDLPSTIKEVYDHLLESGVIVPQPEVEPPTVPMDYSWAQVNNYCSMILPYCL